MSAPLILVVDDEDDLRMLLDFNLRAQGYRTALAASGLEALRRAETLGPDLVLLDIGLPDVSGLDVCRRLRATPTARHIPVLMLTARVTESDRIAGLEAGAEDYVSKPFTLRELLLRIATVLRRHDAVERELLVAGPIEIDAPRMIVRVAGHEVALTQTELKLLTFLVEAGGRVRTREELLRKVVEHPTVAETRTIDTHVKRLRSKLGGAAELIETVRSVGYRLRVQ